MLSSVFLVASVNNFLGAHGLDFGQNFAKCFQFLFAENVSVTRITAQFGAFHVVCHHNFLANAVDVVIDGVVMNGNRVCHISPKRCRFGGIFGKSVFLPCKNIRKSVFLGVVFKEKVLSVCYS